MDANLSLTPATPMAVPPSPASQGAGTASHALRGADFANLLGSLLAAPGRQGLAASELAQAGLQSVALGPQMELITAVAPLPGVGSLMAFARTQGLDEASVLALFGDLEKASLTGQATSDLTSADTAASGSALNAGLLAQAQMAWMSAPPVGAQPLSASVSAMAIGDGALAALGESGQASVIDMSWQVKKMPQTGVPGVQASAGATLGAAQFSDAMQDVLRIRLQPQEALTQRLAILAETGQSTVWGAVSGIQANELMVMGPDADTQEWHSLDLGGLDAGATPASLTLGEPARAALSRADPGIQATGSNLAIQLAQRAEHYQQLSDRLGQALAERLQAQIERGEWKMQMRLDPASLGRIDVQLDMHAGGLDAVFQADNTLTRELIAQGVPKLRESLAQSGMAVANVWVNGESNRQSGGNSTPWQNLQGERSPSGREQGDEAPAEIIGGNGRRAGSSGNWDVLA